MISRVLEDRNRPSMLQEPVESDRSCFVFGRCFPCLCGTLSVENRVSGTRLSTVNLITGSLYLKFRVEVRYEELLEGRRLESKDEGGGITFW